MFANCIPSGVYTTNGSDACFFQAEHSEAQLIVVENEEHLVKYLQVIDRLPKVKGIIVYDDDIGKLREKFTDKKNIIFGWLEFLALADDYNEKKALKKEVHQRVDKLQPGMCCNIVYTSGTTGNPKGVMLSHDNMLYNMSLTLAAISRDIGWMDDGSERLVSYLPLSHSAA